MLKDVESLNLFMYVSEIVAALHAPETLSKLKGADVAGVVALVAALHTRYDAFTEPLITALAAVASDESAYAPGGAGFGGVAGSEDSEAAARRKRMALRLLTDFYLNGVCPLYLLNSLIDNFLSCLFSYFLNEIQTIKTECSTRVCIVLYATNF